jgi:hypothetical protein
MESLYQDPQVSSYNPNQTKPNQTESKPNRWPGKNQKEIPRLPKPEKGGAILRIHRRNPLAIRPAGRRGRELRVVALMQIKVR